MKQSYTLKVLFKRSEEVEKFSGCMLKFTRKTVAFINIIYVKVNKIYKCKQQLYRIKL